MAKRPIFIPKLLPQHLVEEIDVEFSWNPGFAPTQKKKNVAALHERAKEKGLYPVLEVSSKSEVKLGQRLSAFSLQIESPIGKISMESAFQGSKVFEKGGPYTDIYSFPSRDAKKDDRIRNSGKLTAFNFFDDLWPILPKTAFYDYLYLKALKDHRAFLERLYKYKGFTDIEFNPGKSINCQARSCALLVSLMKLDLLDKAMLSKESFLSVITSDSYKQNHSAELKQGMLL